MAFIRIQNKKYDSNGKIVGGIASIRQSCYVRNKKFHSKQVTIEKLGKVICLSDDKKSGIFNSPIRGLVHYDVENNTFDSVDVNDERIKDKKINNSIRVHTVFGDSYLLLELLNKYGLLSIFREMFEKNDNYERFVSHLLYDILKDGSHITCDNFVTKSFISYLIPDLNIKSLKYDSRFYQFMGNDNIKLSFFRKFIALMRKSYPDFGKATYVDSTPLPNDIVNNPFNALCSHGIGQMSIQMRLVLILDQETGIPVWYEVIPGNILDINTLKNITEDALVSLDIRIDNYVLDAGYVSKEFIKDFPIGSEKVFIARMPAKKGYPYKELYKNTKDLFYKGKYQFKRKNYTYFGIQKRLDIFDTPIYEYVYLDHYNATKGFNAYLEHNQEEFDKMKNSDKDFKMVKYGYFILISNQNRTPKEILDEYYCRTDIELIFKTTKEYLKLLPINKWTSDTVKGKILTDMINTIVYLSIKRDLLGKDLSISGLIGATQSLMCFKDENNIVTIECPNKNVKRYYEVLDIKIPNVVDTKSYMKENMRL